MSRLAADGSDVGPEYVRNCIASWRKNGFCVRTVNHPSEVEATAAFSGLEPTPSNPGSPRLYQDRYGASLGDVLDLWDGRGPLAICNADVFMIASSAASRIAALARDAFVYARRTEVAGLGQPFGSIYASGIDFVAFNPSSVAEVVRSPEVRRFQLGAPWWDYVLPAAASFHVPLKRIAEPFILHHSHDRGGVSAQFDILTQTAWETVAGQARLAEGESQGARFLLEALERGDGGKHLAAALSKIVFDGCDEVRLEFDGGDDVFFESVRRTLATLPNERHRLRMPALPDQPSFGESWRAIGHDLGLTLNLARRTLKRCAAPLLKRNKKDGLPAK